MEFVCCKYCNTDRVDIGIPRCCPVAQTEAVAALGEAWLRDQFAMAALSSIIQPMDRDVMTATVNEGTNHEEYYHAVYFATEAYRIADAMMKARVVSLDTK